MNLSQISFTAALTSAAFWTAKAVAIGLAGGLDRSSLETPLFLAGFLCQVVAVVTLVLWWTRSRTIAVRALAGVGGIVAAFLVSTAITALLTVVEPADAGWVWAEINLWIVAAVLLVLTWRGARGAHHGTRRRIPVAASDFR